MSECLHILLIDDDEPDRAAVRRALGSALMTVDVFDAAHGSSVLELLRSGRFHCVLLDHNLPARDGLRVLREIRAAGITTPIIMLSGQGNEELAVDMMKAGATDYLVKSRLSLDHLHKAIHTAVRLDRAERQARQSQAFSHSLMESSADCVKVLDLEGRLEHMNGPGICTMEIDDFAALRGRDWPSLWPEGSRPQVRASIEAAANGQTSRFQSFCPTAKGTPRWWDVQVSPIHGAGGTITGLLSVSRDITVLRSAEQALRAGEEEYHFLSESIPQMVWTALPDGALDYCNVRVSEFSGVSVEQLLGAGWKLLLHPDDLERTIPRWEHSLRTGERYEIEFRLRDTGGTFRWHLARAVPMRDSAGKVLKWFGTCTDIDDQKRAEAELKHSRDTAEAANRAKDQFLSVLSHELRTPLMPVLTTVQSLVMDEQLPESVRAGLQTIRRNVELEARLIDDLLDLTRVAKGRLLLNPEPTDVHDIVHKAMEICRRDIEAKNLTVVMEIDEDDCPISADPVRLQQVFWNLISNAVKFTPQGGTLTLDCHLTDTEDGPGRVHVEVRDTGIGIEPQALTRIFDAFEQGGLSINRLFGGLGLGLAVCKALVTLHGGTIVAHSAGNDRGATFIVELPMHRAAEVDSTACDPPPSALTSEHREIRILLVDDHEDTNKAMARLLQRLGYEVQTAHSVRAALDAADAGPFDLLISDIGLPDGSGLELMGELLRRRPIKGIALSGFGMEEDVQKSKQAGFFDHLTKPINFKRLETAIRQLTS